MSDANPLAWVLASLKTHPEPVSIPDVSELTPLELAAIRSRLQTFSQVATELRKLVDQELAGALQGSALNYGGQIIRASGGRGTAKVQSQDEFFGYLALALERSEDPAALLSMLFPANSVRLTAFPMLAKVMEYSEEGIRDTFIAYDPPSTPLSVMPLSKAPKYLQDLEEGELR